jgi:hypothetical protein
VLYELLTNEVPFPGENFVAVAMRHINEEPPPIRDKRPDVSPRLEAAVHRAMAKRPEDRFQTMADFCRELEANLAEAQGRTAAPPAAPRKKRAPRRQGANPWPIILALVTLIAIGAVIAYLLTHRDNGVPSATPSGGGSTIALSAIGAYDPFGTGGEHDDKAKLATDDNATTYWETEQYRNPPSLGKDGVGLVLDAKSTVQLHQLGVATETPGFTAVIRAGDSPTQFPDTVSSSQTVPDTGATFTIVGKPHRYYLLWITSLGPSYHTARVNEIKAT